MGAWVTEPGKPTRGARTSALRVNEMFTASWPAFRGPGNERRSQGRGRGSCSRGRPLAASQWRCGAGCFGVRGRARGVCGVGGGDARGVCGVAGRVVPASGGVRCLLDIGKCGAPAAAPPNRPPHPENVCVLGSVGCALRCGEVFGGSAFCLGSRVRGVSVRRSGEGARRGRGLACASAGSPGSRQQRPAESSVLSSSCTDVCHFRVFQPTVCFQKCLVIVLKS